MNQSPLGSFESIAIANIRPSATNPRKNFDQLALDELTRSIQEMGVNVPLLLRPFNPYFIEPEGTGFVLNKLVTGIEPPAIRRISFHSTREAAAALRLKEWDKDSSPSVYEVVAGERRLRAAKAAGLEAVPAIVRDLNDSDVLDMQLVENLQREDLHPVEEAEGYRVLLADGASVEDIAKKAGKDVPYVQKRIKLLSLEVDAKNLFAAGHLTLGHALLLARLTPKDQIAALVFLLGIAQWQIKKDCPAEETIRRYAKDFNEKHRRSLIDKGEAQLKEWISSHVLLQLKTAPWDLADAELLPIAGPCSTCPKRSGANAALFSDLTAREDICADPACFATKQKAFADRQLVLAKTSGSPLLKLSTKRGNDKLDKPAVEVKPGAVTGKPGAAVQAMKATVVSNKAVKEGQWVEAKKGECPATVMGVFTDGEKQGRTRYVCADQKCKVHKHQVTTPAPRVTSSAPPRNDEERMAAQAKQRLLEERIDRAIAAEILRKDAQSSHALERLFQYVVTHEWPGEIADLCVHLGIPLKGYTKIDRTLRNEAWRYREKANAAFTDWLNSATLPELHHAALFIIVEGALEGYDDDELRNVAKAFDVDVQTVEERVANEALAEAAAEKPAAAKPKKAAAKKGDRKTAAAGDHSEEEGE